MSGTVSKEETQISRSASSGDRSSGESRAKNESGADRLAIAPGGTSPSSFRNVALVSVPTKAPVSPLV